MARWLTDKFKCHGLAATFVRLHCCPRIKLLVGSAEAVFTNRSIGLYTGSRSAAAAGRIPLLDVAGDRLSAWNARCFAQNGCHYALATFVDNIITAGASPEAAISILEDCAAALATKWDLSMGEDSKEFLVCKGYPHHVHVPQGWKLEATLKSLGHQLDNDGGISSSFSEVTSAMYRSFYGNLNSGLKHASKQAKFRFLRSSVQSVASFRWARWPFQVSYADRLDRVQRDMLAAAFDVRPLPEEPLDAFVQRRRIRTGHLASQCGRWSQAWARSVISWDDHLARRHDEESWSPSLLNWHDTSWLSLRRLLHSSGLESRTRTRAYRGKVHRRWQESLVDARRYIAV